MMSPTYPKINSVYERDQKGRILPDLFATSEIQFLKDADWHWTEKVDGVNLRVTWSPTGANGDTLFQVGGRTDNAQIPAPLVDKVIKILPSAALSEVFPMIVDRQTRVTLYGEGYGARVQKGGGNYIPDGVNFVLFDVLVWSEDPGRHPLWLRYDDMRDIARKLHIDSVPHVFTGPISEAENRIVGDTEFESRWAGVSEPEGLVGRPLVELFDRRGQRILTKMKFKDYRAIGMIA